MLEKECSGFGVNTMPPDALAINASEGVVLAV